MTTFGIDASAYQPGLDFSVVEAQGATFAVARCSRGAGYVDPEFAKHRASAKRCELLFAAYHFLYTDRVAPIKAQADTVVEALGGRKGVPVWIDLEHSKMGGNPSLAEACALRDELRDRGFRVAGLYLPKWYWQQIGSPRLTDWKALWASRYVNGYTKGSIQALYPGDRHVALWETYGGMTPLIAQYTSTAVIPGYSANTVDADASRESITELRERRLFKDFSVREPRQPVNAQVIVEAARRGVAVSQDRRKAKFQRILEIAETLL